MAPTSTLLAAIHNGELNRSPARDVIDSLVAAGVAHEAIDVCEQPRFEENVDVPELMKWRAHQFSLERAWERHLNRFSRARSAASVINLSTYQAKVCLSGEFRRQQWLIRQVETFVSAKHLASWRHFLSSEHETLIVLESDATAIPQTLVRFNQVVQGIPKELPAYANLAGGLTFEALRLQNVSQQRVAGAISFTVPVTNTSCAYLLNRQLAQGLVNSIELNPRDSTLGVDWLINSYFLRATADGQVIACFHADPAVVQHGSLSGVTRSWHPDR